MSLLYFIIATTGVFVALYGWGILCHKLARYPLSNSMITVTVGLGCIIFLGGVLNLIHCAYGWPLNGLLIIGILISIVFYKSRPRLPQYRYEWFQLTILGVIIALIMYFTLNTQCPPRAFNIHDDFEKYFTFPVRMLQTGTLLGGPLNALGSETLGGLAVLQAIVLYHLPVQYINVVDAVFGLFLCLLLSFSMFLFKKKSIFMPIICLLILFFVNPQYVNISALYTAITFMMVAILLFSNFRGYSDNAPYNDQESYPSPLLIGLIYAALISLKTIYILFPICQLIIFIIVLKIFHVDLKYSLKWGIKLVCITFLCLLPWFILHLPEYLNISFAKANPRTDILPLVDSALHLFSNKPVFFDGTSFANYTFVCIAPAVTVIILALYKRIYMTREERFAFSGQVASATATVCVYFFLLFMSPFISGYVTSLRYALPFLIASTPVLLFFIYLRASKEKQTTIKFIFSVIPICIGISIIIIFANSLTARVHNANTSGSILAFADLASRQEYIDYCQNVIYGDWKERVLKAQKQVPAGKEVVVWISTPFHLDFRRNIIYDVERSGISNLWASMPDVEYFIFQYEGPAIRPAESYLRPLPGKRERFISEQSIAMLAFFQNLSQSTDEIYNDDQIMVLKKKNTL